MKKIIYFLALFLSISAANFSLAQVAQNSWSFGFGFTYPRFMSTDVRPQEENYGGFISLQRNFSEFVGLRLLANYSHMKGRIGGYDPVLDRYYYTNGTKVPSLTEFMHSNVLSGSLDLLYYFVPCLSVSPYMGLGLGIASLNPSWPSNVFNPNVKSVVSAQLNLIFGSEWRLSNNWNLKTEFGYHSTAGQLDGVVNNTRHGIFGSDADGYITFNAGLVYYFSKGAPSKYCELYSGIKVKMSAVTSSPTVEEIDSVIQQHVPKIEEKKVVVEKTITSLGQTNWILFGVNFDSQKSELSPEASVVLENDIQTLKENPDVKVEIEGYTDNVESPSESQKLSLDRAESVKSYLVHEGIEGSRITTIGMGDKNPKADNGTEDGRALNRRVEFKIIK